MGDHARLRIVRATARAHRERVRAEHAARRASLERAAALYAALYIRWLLGR